MNTKYIITASLIGVILLSQWGTVALAQTQHVADKKVDDLTGTSSTTTSPESQVFGRGVDIVKNMIPGSIQNATGSVFARLSDFRSQEYYLVEIARIENIEKIDALNEKEIISPAQFTWKSHAERILRYTHWMFLVLGGTILAHAWIFYFILFLTVYSTLRALWRRVRSAGV